MLTFIDFESDKIVGVRVKGRLSDLEFESVLEAMEERLKKHPKISFYNEIEDFGGTSIENYFKDMKFGLAHWDRFDKLATVTDAKWMVKIVPVLDKIFPNMEMKSFPMEEKAAAKAWVQSP